jgi:hypothetical protein
MTIYSFRKLNPDWEIHLCSYKAVGQWKFHGCLDSRDYRGEDYTAKCLELGIHVADWIPPIQNLSPVYASDLFRWAYLNSVGGWYSDMDVLWVQPMTDLYQRTKDCDFVGCETYNLIGVGLLAGSPNDLWNDLYRAALNDYDADHPQSTGTLVINRYVHDSPKFINWKKALQVLNDRHPTLTIEILKHEVGCPFNFTQVDRIFKSTETLPTDCVCLHWFGGHKISQEFNNRLTEKNFRETHNTFTKYAEKL